MLYVVMLEHTDGHVTFAGKESWQETETPEEIFTSLKSARGKVRYWEKVSRSPSKSTELDAIHIKPAVIEVSCEVADTISC